MSDRETGFTLAKSRFEGFSDGVFAIAITLLILEIHLPQPLPATASIQPTMLQQTHALLGIWPQYFVYAATFATVGIMWMNHNALFRYVEHITHSVALANLLLLGLVCFLPFPTEVVAQYGLSRVAIVYYGLALCAISFAYLLLQRQAMRAQGTEPKLRLWNIVGLTLYPLATLIGYAVPLLGLLIIAILALFYAVPSNIESAAIRRPGS